MFDRPLVWAVIAAVLGVTVVRKAVIIPFINYFVALKDVEALSNFTTGPNTKTLLLPMEASGILSSLAGITEIAKEAFAGDGEN